MTDSIPFQQENAQSSITKRSLSPDEGEIIEDVKRRRESRSPSVNSARYQGDGRQHRVVYDGQSSRRGYGYQDRDTHDERRHDDAERYRDRDRRYEHAREPRSGERRDGRGFHPSRYHANERNSRQLTRSGNSSRHRSISSDQKYDSSHSRERTHSPNPLSSRNRISPSPQPKQVQFADDTKPPAMCAPKVASMLISSAQEPEPVQEITMIDEEALIEARRRKREAILAKYQGQSTPSLVDNLKLQSAEASPAPASPINKIGNSIKLSQSDTLDSPRPGSRDTTPDFDTGDEKTFEFANSGKDKTASESREGPSAADYDPTDDMKLDNEKRHQHETVAPLDSADYDETKPTDQVILIPEKTPPLQQTPPQAADEDEDDMFATPVSPKSRPKSKELIANKAAPVVEARQLDASMLDTWHDLEGYYIVILGEILNKRYVVQANLGKGMFSGVVRCLDNEQNGKQVAIKILRNNEAMRKAGLKEIGVLEKIMAADPEGRKHIIRFEGWFEHKGHLCLVFENLSLNLREVLKKFGRDVGINLKAVRAYAQQMFVGLSLLRKCNLLHADLKPDNILVRASFGLC
jgi:serine/threonine-protein kinase PRP4